MNTTHVREHHHIGQLRVSEWVLGILGVISAFLGLFILFGGENQSIGLGGEASWTVSEIHPAWGYGLLAGGLVGLVIAGLFLRHDRAVGHVPERTSRGDLVAHSVAFVLVNGFLWAQDIAIGGGVDYAYWITIPWGLGLIGHAYSVYMEEQRSKES